ncbi:MAG: hypothetical protein ABI537_03130 [Casimicrobiaceae bacterium]
MPEQGGVAAAISVEAQFQDLTQAPGGVASSRGSGGEFFVPACKLGLEGALSKRVDSTKCAKREELVIGGYTDPQGSRTGVRALRLSVNAAGGALRYPGRVGTDFDDTTLTLLHDNRDAENGCESGRGQVEIRVESRRKRRREFRRAPGAGVAIMVILERAV